MMTGKPMSLPTVNNRIASQAGHDGRPAILAFVARLLAPTDQVRSRLRAAQTSLEAAAARFPDAPPIQQRRPSPTEDE
jgi:hypothetical protein